MADLIRRNPTGLNIVSIRSSRLPDSEYAFFDEFRANYKDIIIEKFDDIKVPEEGWIVPELEHVRRILGWAEERENIAVHCTAGISRSSAIAYLIACQRSSPKQAVKVLDPAKHAPNRLIIKLGMDVLGDEAVMLEYIKWFKSHPVG
ncbi:MAG TPA: hypothetical protein DET40_23090 [Lentisphaeria bacterium]|nr:hypothetical protein [Lentisphaeria bacterium]